MMVCFTIYLFRDVTIDINNFYCTNKNYFTTNTINIYILHERSDKALAVVINLDEERLFRSYDMIGNAIVDYIKDMDLTWEIEMARQIYFGKFINTMDRKQSVLSYKPFIQWLIFSYKLHNGHSLIECIYNNYVENMGSYEKNALNSLKSTYESFYKIYRIEESKILVKDIFTKEEKYISHNLLVHNIKRYSGIFSRIVTINNKNIPIPGYSVMSNSFLKDTEQYIIEKYKDFNRFNSPVPIHNFINSHSLMIHRYFLYHDI